MLRLFAGFAVVLLLSSVNIHAVSGTSKLNWMTNYEDASIKAKRERKAVLLFFTGSDWCGWCHKLENEALDTTDFSDSAGDQFVFVVVDFPLKTSLDQNTTAQNKELQKKYDVKGFPTVVLLDENGQLIGDTGYRPGGGKSYAEYLKKLVEDFKSYKQKVSKINPTKIEAKDLEALYAKSIELCRKDDAERIVKLGLQNKDNHFFLLERYRFLANEGNINNAEAIGIKTLLLTSDSPNMQKLHYELAVIEFEALSKDLENENYTAEMAVAPLIAFIDRYSADTPDNFWQLYMVISQVYLDKRQLKDALKYAQVSHISAPESVQPDIQRFIVNIQK
jgi:protein disulfide-isomerase